ncbi:MAG: flagellar hook protein FlgE [Deltaproteobacteria bacterium]|nr:flagellar hook protein FlgE [Deltaproteobacteria bacterium]
MIGPIAAGVAGMSSAVNRFDRAAARTASPGGADDVGAVVDQIAAKNDFAANVAVVRTADEMVGTLLDIVA